MGICVLGPPQVEGNGMLAPRDRLVLAVLAVRRGQVVMPDQVADAVWGDRPPASWPTQVQICVGRLRKVLTAGSIETVAGGYRMTLAGDEVDADRFEQLITRGRTLAATGEPERAAATFTKALGLWRGRPFEDLSEWEPASSEAARLEELRRSADEELAGARLDAGQHREVAATAEALVAAEPWRERRWEILALAQYRCGRQADALRTLARARRLLVEQLGIDPGPGLTGLEAAVLRQDETLAAPEASPVPLATECPYKGLAAYDVGDAELFFGRDAEVAACLDRLRSAPLLVVAGPSGCGKSSLVRAGLVPALARQGRPAVLLVPGGDPDTALTEALATVDGKPVVVVDQFEELFAVGVDPETAAGFCRRLGAHASPEAPVVICVRADHLAGVSIDPGFARLAEHGLHLVSPLAGDLLREAIEQPAAQAGLRLEPGLVDLLVRDCEGEPGAMPMLSHALAETWRRRDGHVLTVDGYRASGGIRGAVARSADRLYDNLPAEQRTMLRGLMLRLVTPSVDGDPVRCRVPTRSLVGDRQRENVVALLVRARLVTAEADTIELAHEALARAWPRLQSWLDDDAAGQRILRHLVAAAAGWDTLGRPDSELYRGARLDTALEWRSTTHPDLTALESEFLDASAARAADEHDSLIAQGRRDARQNRRLRRAFVGVAVLAVLAMAAGLVAYRQGRRADAARRASEMQALINNAVALRASRSDLAALLAAEAHRLAPSAATESALFGLFTAYPGIGRRVEVEASLLANNVAEIFPDGDTIVSADERGVVQLIDVATGAVRTRLGTAGPPINTPAFAVTGDGRYLAVALVGTEPYPEERSRLTVWDLRTGRRRFPDVELTFRAATLDFNADGSQLAAGGGYEGRAEIRDATTGRLQHELDAIPRPADAIYFTNTVALAYTSDDQLIVGSQAGPIRVIDPTTGEELSRIDGPPQTGEGRIVLSSDTRSMVTEGATGVMRYELPSGRPLWAEPAAVDCQAGSAVAERIGLVLCGEFGGRILAVDLVTGGVTGPRFDNQRGGAYMLMTADGTTMLTIDGFGYTVWRLDGSGLVHRVLPYTDALSVEGDRDGTESVRLSPVEEVGVIGYLPGGDALLVATTAADGPDAAPVIDVVDAGTGAVRDRLDGAVAALPAGDPARLVVLFDDNTVGAYDVSSGERVGHGVDPGFPVDELIVDGDRVYAWNHEGDETGGRIAGVDLATGTVRAPDIRLDDYLGRAAAASGAIYTVSVEGDALVLHRRDGASGAPRAHWDHDMPVNVVAGEDVVIANTAFGELLTLDPDTLRDTGELLPTTRGELETMSLSADGQRLLVLGVDRGVRLYDVGTRSQLGTEIAIDRVAGAAIRPDGREAAVATGDGIVIWDLDPSRWVEGACAIAGRNLTRAEWSTHIGDLAPYRATCPQYAPAE